MTFMSVITLWSDIVISRYIICMLIFPVIMLGVHANAILLYMLLYQLEAKQ